MKKLKPSDEERANKMLSDIYRLIVDIAGDQVDEANREALARKLREAVENEDEGEGEE